MAWSISKIKDGLVNVGKKVLTGAKNVGNFLNKNIIQPLAPAVSQALISSGDPKMAAAGAGVLAGSQVLNNVMNVVNRRGGS